MARNTQHATRNTQHATRNELYQKSHVEDASYNTRIDAVVGDNQYVHEWSGARCEWEGKT